MNLRELAFFYHNLVVGFNAGLSLAKSFESLATTEKDPLRKKKARYVAEAIKRGDSLSTALKASAFVPLLDLPIIEVGEKTGKLSYVFQLLQKNYEVSADAERTIRSGLVMPAFIFVTAVFLPSVPELFTAKITLTAYLTKNLSILFVVFGAARLCHYLFLKSYYDEDWAQRRQALFKTVPVLRNLSSLMATEKFTTALELNLHVGQTMFDALKIAGHASGDYDINLASRRIISEVKSGKTLTSAFAAESVISEAVKSCIELGTESGETPRLLNEAAQRMKTDIHSAIVAFSGALPLFIYWLAITFAGLSILGLYIKSFFSLIKMF